MNPAEKLEDLRRLLAATAVDGRLALAFSGGLDSRFLAYTAARAGLEALLLHASGPHIARKESAFAHAWAKDRGFALRDVPVNPLEREEVAANSRERCYHCKRALFTGLARAASGLPLCDGTQASDSLVFRPGRAALRELGIISPLAGARLGKQEIVRLAGETGLDFADQPPRPCLLTRFAYGLRPDAAAFQALELGEEAVESALRGRAARTPGADAPGFRLRLVAAGTWELHMTPLCPESGPEGPEGEDGCGDAPEGLGRLLEEAVFAASGIRVRRVRVMRALSGFFDRE